MCRRKRSPAQYDRLWAAFNRTLPKQNEVDTPATSEKRKECCPLDLADALNDDLSLKRSWFLRWCKQGKNWTKAVSFEKMSSVDRFELSGREELLNFDQIVEKVKNREVAEEYKMLCLKHEDLNRPNPRLPHCKAAHQYLVDVSDGKGWSHSSNTERGFKVEQDADETQIDGLNAAFERQAAGMASHRHLGPQGVPGPLSPSLRTVPSPLSPSFAPCTPAHMSIPGTPMSSTPHQLPGAFSRNLSASSLGSGAHDCGASEVPDLDLGSEAGLSDDVKRQLEELAALKHKAKQLEDQKEAKRKELQAERLKKKQEQDAIQQKLKNCPEHMATMSLLNCAEKEKKLGEYSQWAKDHDKKLPLAAQYVNEFNAMVKRLVACKKAVEKIKDNKRLSAEIRAGEYKIKCSSLQSRIDDSSRLMKAFDAVRSIHGGK